MRELRGRRALLTGAGGGLGTYVARSLASQGVDLALSDLPTVSVDAVATDARSRGVRADAVPADVADSAGLEDLVRCAEESIGPIDILVNNAGVEFGGPFLDQSRQQLEAIARVNLLAVMELTRLTLPGMLARGGGATSSACPRWRERR